MISTLTKLRKSTFVFLAFGLILLSTVSFISAEKEFKVYDVNGKKHKLNFSAKKQVIVLKGNISCNTCFKELDNFFKEINFSDSTIKTISLSESNPVSLMSNYFTIKELMPNTSHHYFEACKQINLFEEKLTKNGIFDYFKIDKTPEVLLISKSGNVFLFDYFSIFDQGEIKESFRKSVSKFLNQPEE